VSFCQYIQVRQRRSLLGRAKPVWRRRALGARAVRRCESQLTVCPQSTAASARRRRDGRPGFHSG